MSSICMKVRENHSLQKRACVTILLLRVLVSQYCYTGHLCHTIVTRGTCVTLLLHGVPVSHYCYTGCLCDTIVTRGISVKMLLQSGGYLVSQRHNGNTAPPPPKKRKQKQFQNNFKKKKSPQCAYLDSVLSHTGQQIDALWASLHMSNGYFQTVHVQQQSIQAERKKKKKRMREKKKKLKKIKIKKEKKKAHNVPIWTLAR